MSIKEYFAIPILKQKVLDFLKAKGDFQQLHQKHKRSFRAHIAEQDGDYFICDDQHQIKCVFSNQCKEKFEQCYPSSVRIYNIVNMLVCVQEYQLILQSQDLESGQKRVINKPGENSLNEKMRLGNKLEVVMEINELQVISFDRFTLRQCQSIDYDESIRIHINFVSHFLSKKSLIEECKSLTLFPITKNLLTSESLLRQNKIAYNNHQQVQQNQSLPNNYNKQTPQQNNSNVYEQPRRRFDSSDYYDTKPIEDKIKEKDPYKPIVEFKSNQSMKQFDKESAAKRQKLKRKLGKILEDKNQDGFLSCEGTQDNEMIENLGTSDNDSAHNSQILQPIVQIRSFNPHLQSQKGNNHHSIGHTQKQEELKKIDEAMEDFDFNEEDLEEFEEEMKQGKHSYQNSLEFNKKTKQDIAKQSQQSHKKQQSQKSQTNQAKNSQDSINKDILQSSKLHQEILKSRENSQMIWNKQEEENYRHNDDIQASLHNILGDANNDQDDDIQSMGDIDNKQKQLTQLGRDEDAISNSDSVLEQEKILKEVEEEKNKDRVELDIKLTREQELQDQLLMFGSLPPENMLGFGLNSTQNQKEFIEYKKQGQGGQNSESKKTVPKEKIPESQDDLLDFLDDRDDDERQKDNLFNNRALRSQSNKNPSQVSSVSKNKQSQQVDSQQKSQKSQNKTPKVSQQDSQKQKTPAKSASKSVQKQSPAQPPKNQRNLFDFMQPKRDVKMEQKSQEKDKKQAVQHSVSQSSDKDAQSDKSQSQQGIQKGLIQQKAQQKNASEKILQKTAAVITPSKITKMEPPAPKQPKQQAKSDTKTKVDTKKVSAAASKTRKK
eukprot:403374183